MSKLHVRQIEGVLKRELDGLLDLSDYQTHSDEKQKEKAFLTRGLAALAVAHLTETPLAELAPFVTDGQHDGGIDLIYYDQKERMLYLVQSKWHSEGHGSITLGEALKFIDGVKKVLDNDLNGMNSRVIARSGDIKSAIYDANSQFVLAIVHTGQEDLSSDVAGALDQYVLAQNDSSELMQLKILKQSDVHKTVAAGIAGAPINLDVQLSDFGQLRDPNKAVYGQVSAADVARWLSDHGNKLFSKNLRQFISGSPVNQQIVETLLKRPNDFWYLNNGVTAIASSIEKKPIGGNSTSSGIFECMNFSVVNGAQSVGSIHAAYSKDAETSGKAVVLVRIIEVPDSSGAFALDVTRCTNTQNAIERRDFVALDPQQARIRQELRFDNIDYVYKTGESAQGAPLRGFDLLEATVALACASPDVAQAVQAKREIGRLWEDITKPPYSMLFNSSLQGPYLWELVQVLREIESELTLQTKSFAGREALVCVHGNRVIQWLCFKRLNVKPGFVAASLKGTIASIVCASIKEINDEVRNSFSDSYPASLFKNLTKCRKLAAAVL